MKRWVFRSALASAVLLIGASGCSVDDGYSDDELFDFVTTTVDNSSDPLYREYELQARTNGFDPMDSAEFAAESARLCATLGEPESDTDVRLSPEETLTARVACPDRLPAP